MAGVQFFTRTEIPTDFRPHLTIVTCFCEYTENNVTEILILRRSPHKLFGNAWGLPGGKKNRKESPTRAAQRELREETGVYTSLREMIFTTLDFMRLTKEGRDFIFYTYHILWEKRPQITLNEEHTEYKWMTPVAIHRNYADGTMMVTPSLPRLLTQAHPLIVGS